jgi:hypothetical protein
MSKLPVTPRPAVSALRIASLRNWLAEWSCEQELRAMPDAPAAASAGRGATRGSEPAVVRDPAADPAPAAGQVRLFHPHLALPDFGPVFVLVLEPVAGGFVVAPLSRFAWPALPGELLTGRAEPPARVACLWLVCQVAGELLTRSWMVGKLKAAELRDALALRRHEQEGAGLPRRLANRTGAPLWSVLDPRNDYVAEERGRTAFLARSRRGNVSDGALEWNGQILDSGSLDRAAEPPEDYDAR